MSNLCRRTLLAFTFVAFAFVASNASAQMDCAECSPYENHCSDPCLQCVIYGMDGCVQWTESDCGGGYDIGCLADNCTPSWYESNRQNRGTYDGNSWSGCTHHRVDLVTMTDANQCNTSSYYWSYNFCQDWIDSSKNGCCWPSCCSGYGDNGVGPLSCNGQHNC